MKELNLNQTLWLTIFALLGIWAIFNLEAILDAIKKGRVVIIKEGIGPVIEGRWSETTDEGPLDFTRAAKGNEHD